MNMAFIDWADRNHIIVHVIPPHLTHQLQPLDVRVFGLLSTAYSNQLDKLIHNSMSLVSMTKRLFYPLFKAAYKEAFSQKNIENAFAKAGI